MNKILDSQLFLSVNQNGITEFTKLQQICIPKLKSGNDLLCLAQKESGKSLTIVIGILQQLKKQHGDNPRALIIVPDIDRAIALKNEFTRLGKYTDLRVHMACENEKIDDQKDRIYMGSDVVIGTVRRLNQIYSLYALNTSTVKIFAIDDADETIKNNTFAQIIRLSQSPTKTQFVLFANHASEWIERFAEKAMNVQEVIEFDEE